MGSQQNVASNHLGMITNKWESFLEYTLLFSDYGRVEDLIFCDGKALKFAKTYFLHVN